MAIITLTGDPALDELDTFRENATRLVQKHNGQCGLAFGYPSCESEKIYGDPKEVPIPLQLIGHSIGPDVIEDIEKGLDTKLKKDETYGKYLREGAVTLQSPKGTSYEVKVELWDMAEKPQEAE